MSNVSVLVLIVVLVLVIIVTVGIFFPGMITLVDSGRRLPTTSSRNIIMCSDESQRIEATFSSVKQESEAPPLPPSLGVEVESTQLTGPTGPERQPRSAASQSTLFTTEQCMDIVSRLENMRDRWQSQSVGKVMQTCGRPSYLGAAFPDAAGVSNADMLAAFPDVYEVLKRGLEEQYPATQIVFGGGSIAPYAGVPGFHIFRASRAFQWPVASLHVDRQYVNAGFAPSGSPPPTRTMSFTVLMQEPEGGAGLHIWDVSSDPNSPGTGGTYPPVSGTVLPLPAWLLINAREHHHRIKYEVGSMVTHDGHHYHLIAPNRTEATRDRITIQGHGIWRTAVEGGVETLYVYW